MLCARMLLPSDTASPLALLAVCLVVAACSGDSTPVQSSDAGVTGGSGGGATSAPPTLPCDVDAVLEAKCRRCHVKPDESCPETCVRAPVALSDWQDLTADKSGKPLWQTVGDAVRTGLMPPVTQRLDPPVEPLTDEEKSVLLGWVDDGAPPGDGAACK